MINTFKILILNYDKIGKKYVLGKQEILSLEFKELENLLKDIPYDDGNVIPIQIITEEFIITKTSKKSFTWENNRFLPHTNIKTSKKEFKLDKFRVLYDSYDKINQRDFRKSYAYTFLISVIWFYFTIVNIQIIIILLTIDFGNVSINIFLLWLAMITYIGFYNFSHENLPMLLSKKTRIPIEYFNPSIIIPKKNEVSIFFLFTSQLIYFLIFYMLYFRDITIVLIETLLIAFYVFLFFGVVISIHYLLIIIYRYRFNLLIKKKSLVFLYELLQNSNIQSENYHLIIKLISEIENSKAISYGPISKIVGILTFFFAIIPNIV